MKLIQDQFYEFEFNLLTLENPKPKNELKKKKKYNKKGIIGYQ